jgi:ankyrin repeat protein
VSKPLRDLVRVVVTLGVIGGAIALAWGPVARFLDPPDTPLQIAVTNGDVEAVRRLLGPATGKDAAVTAYSAYERALRELSPSKPETVAILRLILEREPKPATIGYVTGLPAKAANIEFRPARSSGQSSTLDTTIAAVEIAAQRWSPEGVRALLDHGLDVKSDGVASALTTVAANRCTPILTMLLDAGADPNARDRNRDTPLAMARRMKHADIEQVLVSRGARE